MENKYLEEFVTKSETTDENEPILTIKPQNFKKILPLGSLILIDSIFSLFFAIPIFFLINFCNFILSWLGFYKSIDDGFLFLGSYICVFIFLPLITSLFIKNYANTLFLKVYKYELCINFTSPFFYEKSIRFSDITSIQNFQYNLDKNTLNSIIMLSTENGSSIILPGVLNSEEFVEMIKTLKQEKDLN